MAFPQIADPTTTVVTADNNHLINMPPVVEAGDILIAFIGYAGSVTKNTPTDWDLLVDLDEGGIWTKLADGTEGGGTVDFTTNINVKAAAHVYRVTNFSLSIEGVSVDHGSTVNPDPPNLIPTFGLSDTLWISGFIVFAILTATNAPSDGPDNYSTPITTQQNNGSGTDIHITTCRRELAATSDNPSSFTIGAAAEAVSFTIAIQGELTSAEGLVSLPSLTSSGSANSSGSDGGDFLAVGSFRGFSTSHRLESIYASIAGHTAPGIARDTHLLMASIGRERGINITSGYRSFEDNLAILYRDLTGNAWNGNRSSEQILRAIEAEL